MKILKTRADVRAFTENIKTQGGTVCLVPTMGFFHEGHLALMKRAKAIADVVLVSLFVNPTQFAPSEDLGNYPRDFASDCTKAKSVGVDGLFYPEISEMYPEPCQALVSVPTLSHQLCGISRPHHFQGVATIVLKLFNLCQPDSAIFGEKDFQQLAVIQQMVRDLNVPVEIHSLPTIRETDGLAMSSRNSYLLPEERKQAHCLFAGIQLAQSLAAAGKSAAAILEAVIALIEQQPSTVIDYISIVNRHTLDSVDKIDQDSLIVMAVKIGKPRLLDNGILLIGDKDVSLNA